MTQVQIIRYRDDELTRVPRTLYCPECGFELTRNCKSWYCENEVCVFDGGIPELVYGAIYWHSVRFSYITNKEEPK